MLVWSDGTIGTW